MLDVLGIEQHYIDTDDDIGKIKPGDREGLCDLDARSRW